MLLIPSRQTTILTKSPWDTQQKHAQNWTFVKTPCVSMLPCLYNTVLVTASPSSPKMKVPAMILGVKGASNQHCIEGGVGMREIQGFLRKHPKSFGQDCTFFCLTVIEQPLLILLALIHTFIASLFCFQCISTRTTVNNNCVFL